MKRLVFLAACCFFVLNLYSQSVEINLSGIRNNRGWIRLALFESQSSFEDEKPVWEVCIDKKDVSGGCLNYRIEALKAGTYGLAVLDDENGNGKLDSKVIIPAEGVGFSNFPLKGVRKPRFTDFCFSVTPHVTICLPVRLKYYL